MPTLVTLVMFPILAVVYIRLARREEQDALSRFGDTYRQYQEEVPAFIPRWPGKPATHASQRGKSTHG